MTPSRRELEHIAIRQRVHDHAEPHHGIFRRADLDALQIDHGVIRFFLKHGWWTRLHHGVYIDSDVLANATDPIQRVRILSTAALAALPGPAYAFGPSAGGLHGLAVDRYLLQGISIVRPRDTDQRALHRKVTAVSELGEISVHRHAIDPAATTEIDGIPVVDRRTAAITTAARSDLMWAVATLDSLLWDDHMPPDELAACIDPWRGLRGIGIVRQAAKLARHGAQTPLESISRLRLVSSGIPEPLLQFAVYDPDGLIGYADMAWPDLKVIGEADGLLKYQDRSDLIAEKAREDRMRDQGWIVVRWTWDEILRTPHVVVARIRRAMAEALRRSA
jgi:hypothetical protein